ncbi:hypothetical protein PsYK624_029530 [Phanerochaete sordida]|uniref:Uncharacterized protein n=1 Tax=Phanerochaete sordida TaxID=48140 RepID=A0A9P3G2V2_9APHY|nr:hypothetical protein PsYK624_029530 [Phanerochaete sordida]
MLFALAERLAEAAPLCSVTFRPRVELSPSLRYGTPLPLFLRSCAPRLAVLCQLTTRHVPPFPDPRLEPATNSPPSGGCRRHQSPAAR